MRRFKDRFFDKLYAKLLFTGNLDNNLATSFTKIFNETLNYNPVNK